MWASGTKCVGSCGSRIRSLDWQDSSDGQGGWLVTGCEEGVVGISWIASEDAAPDDNLACTKEACFYKSHFNMRGHVGQVRLVRWMPSGDRLVSYDSWGKIIIWRNRANVLACECQMNTAVHITDIQWSPCGYYIVICGKDGHIQMFSGLNGLNLFSIQVQATSSLSSKAQSTCCSWNKTGTRIAFGTEAGEILLLDPAENGSSISTMTLKRGVAVCSILWYGPVVTCQTRGGRSYQSQSLSVLLRNGHVVCFTNTSSSHCMWTLTGIQDGLAAWDSSYSLLAVVGYMKEQNSRAVRFLNPKGYVLFTINDALPQIPRRQALITSITWGLNDSALFIAQGDIVHSVTVNHSLPSLQFLCRRVITDEFLKDSSKEEEVHSLPLPKRELEALQALKTPLIPDPLRSHGMECVESLFKPLAPNQRLHCTLEATESGAPFTGFTLKYEHLNQWIPLLQARRKPRKGGKVFTSGFLIEPAFDFSASSNTTREGKHWVNKSYDPQLMVDPGERLHRSKSFYKQLRSIFKPGHRIMDISQQEAASATAAGSPRVPDHVGPVLAEVEGNYITNRYRFSTSSPLFQDGDLGNLNIISSYVKCNPRKMNVCLSVEGNPKDGEDTVSLQSKKPDWNEHYQIYELDFGGRVSKDSIKNFQIEKNGEVVLQFGKTHGAHYCLDFQAPFSPIQAICVALACIQ